MSAGAISGASGGASTAELVGENGFATLSSAEFIRIMTEELTHQDPLKPQDSAALLEQLSSLRDIESQMALQESLESLVLQNQLATAGNIIGKAVSGLDDSNAMISGVVEAIRVVEEEVWVRLESGQQLKMNNVVQVDDLNQIESLVLENQVSTAGQLIGCDVQGINENGLTVNGVVTSVVVEDGLPMLELTSGHKLAIDRLLRVSAADG